MLVWDSRPYGFQPKGPKSHISAYIYHTFRPAYACDRLRCASYVFLFKVKLKSNRFSTASGGRFTWAPESCSCWGSWASVYATCKWKEWLNDLSSFNGHLCISHFSKLNINFAYYKVYTGFRPRFWNCESLTHFTKVDFCLACDSALELFPWANDLWARFRCFKCNKYLRLPIIRTVHHWKFFLLPAYAVMKVG